MSDRASYEQMPEELSPHRVGRRLLQLAAVVLAVVLIIVFGPDLGGLREHLADASAGWLVAGVGLELLSALSYVVIFRAVFCARMGWGLAYQIGMSEQAANSVLSVSGAGGLALGAWALHRGGMRGEYIARRSVAFFFLTSVPNVGGVVVFALLFALGALGHDRNPAFTYGFGAAALLVSVVVVVLVPRLAPMDPDAGSGEEESKTQAALRWVRTSLGQGVRDGLLLLRQRSIGVLVGSVGFLAFDIAVLWATFKAFGYSPALGVLVLGYLIGQLGGNLPLPGGLGGVDGGLIGVFALYHQPLAVTTAAVLIYHAIAIWVPALVGSLAFVQLRRTLAREEQPAAMCAPLAEPIEIVREPLAAGAGGS